MKLNGNTIKAKVNGNNTQFNEHLRIITNEYLAPKEHRIDEPDANVLDDKSKIELIESLIKKDKKEGKDDFEEFSE